MFASGGCTHNYNGTWILQLALSRYSGDPDVIPDHWPQ
jgi:hypothetical protein